MGELVIGLSEGDKFTLPVNAVARTFALIGQRGSGKSSLAAVMAEEMCKAALPWMALDPTGVWWGLRTRADGRPSGFPVVVFGGEHGDLPLEKGQGRKIAEACIAANVFAVIDLSRESKTTWRYFVRDFAHALKELRPEDPRHIFIEEAPEFVPQRDSYQLGKECKEAVETLVRLGRNWGYGATVITQRPAKVDKDVLSQCESLFVMRTSGKHDRSALRDWLEANESEADLNKALGQLASLPDGGAWFWSPQFLKTFVKVQVRHRETFHPGATRKVGATARSVQLSDVGDFVAKVRKELTKTTVSIHRDLPTKKGKGNLIPPSGETVAGRELSSGSRNVNQGGDLAWKHHVEKDALQGVYMNQVSSLKEELSRERQLRQDAERRLDAVRSYLKPQYDSLQKLFVDLASVGGLDTDVWAPWLDRARKRGCGRMLEELIKKPELTRHQLGILAHVSPKSSTFRAYMAWLKRAGLVEVEGDTVKLRRP